MARTFKPNKRKKIEKVTLFVLEDEETGETREIQADKNINPGAGMKYMTAIRNGQANLALPEFLASVIGEDTWEWLLDQDFELESFNQIIQGIVDFVLNGKVPTELDDESPESGKE